MSNENQEAFDKVAAHLIAQGARSVNGGEECMYRGGGGMSCAVGCLIPPEQYSTVLEGLSGDEG